MFNIFVPSTTLFLSTLFLLPSLQATLTHGQLKNNWDSTLGKIGTEDFPPYKNFLSKQLSDEDKQMLVRNCESTKILIPSGFKQLVERCIAKWKTETDNNAFKKYLNTISDVDQYIISLVRRRPLAFLTSSDTYLTADGASGDHFTEQAVAENYSKYMCYKELELSPYVNLIADTTNVNDGKRDNRGVPDDKGAFEKDGVIIAAVGARYEVPGKMEYKHSVTTKESASQRADLLKEFLPFWFGDNVPPMKFNEGEKFSFEGKELCDRYIKISESSRLDAAVYFAIMKKRYETIFFAAAEKAKASGKKAFLHLVGLGLGVWQKHNDQTNLQAAAAKQVLNEHPEWANHILVADFSWVEASNWAGFVGDTKLTKSKRNPWATLTSNELGATPRDQVLLVADFAWDGGSFVGNEFWKGMLHHSGDPAAACAGDIAITMNPLVNTEMLQSRRLVSVPAVFGGSTSSKTVPQPAHPLDSDSDAGSDSESENGSDDETDSQLGSEKGFGDNPEVKKPSKLKYFVGAGVGVSILGTAAWYFRKKLAILTGPLKNILISFKNDELKKEESF